MRTAVIGLGRMGLRHLRVVRSCGFTIVGAADPRPDARAAAAALGVDPSVLFEDADGLLAAVTPDCVIIATTAPTHAALVVAAAAAGVRCILCEKPMAVSLEECDRMIAACREAGSRLAVNHQMRFMGEYAKAKAIVDSPAFGRLASMSVVAGNCGLAMNGTHYVEAFRFLTGEPPVSVVATLSPDIVPNPRGHGYEDRGGWVRVCTASGRRLNLELGTDQGHGMSFLCAGRNGTLMVDQQAGMMHLSTRLEENRDLPTTRFWTPAAVSADRFEPDDAIASSRGVLEALALGDGYPDGEAGRTAVAVIVAAHVSHEAGGIAIDPAGPDLPRDRRFAWA